MFILQLHLELKFCLDVFYSAVNIYNKFGSALFQTVKEVAS